MDNPFSRASRAERSKVRTNTLADQPDQTGPEPRSAWTLTGRRTPLEWPEQQDFRILSIDGGGIRGIFPAAFLAELENRHLDGESIANYFDLITGTSTGGIIAIGLGAGLTAADLLQMYLRDGERIFPPRSRLARVRNIRKAFVPMYDIQKLEELLMGRFGSRTLQESSARLCIPSCDGTHSDVWVFKTPHHPDYRIDGTRHVVDVALATSAAPTYFRPQEDGSFRLLDGGLWANNPILIGVVAALSAFRVSRDHLRVLSLGYGSEPYRVGNWRMRGGKIAWLSVISAAMRYQSLGALGQAYLLVGADNVLRVEPELSGDPIGLDDWRRAHSELPAAAALAADQHGEHVRARHLSHPVLPYYPLSPTRGVRVTEV